MPNRDRGFGSSEGSSDRRREVQEHEAREQHRERTNTAPPLVVLRPVRPVLIGRPVVGRVAAAREPPDQKENGEDDAGQGQQSLRCMAGERQAAASPRQFGRTIGESFLNPQIAQ